jgi:hypothetical protein
VLGSVLPASGPEAQGDNRYHGSRRIAWTQKAQGKLPPATRNLVLALKRGGSREPGVLSWTDGDMCMSIVLNL